MSTKKSCTKNGPHATRRLVLPCCCGGDGHLAAGHLRSVLVHQLRAERQIARDRLQIVGDHDARLVQHVRIGHGQRGGEVVAAIVGRQLGGADLALLDLFGPVTNVRKTSTTNVTQRPQGFLHNSPLTCDANLKRSCGVS